MARCGHRCVRRAGIIKHTGLCGGGFVQNLGGYVRRQCQCVMRCAGRAAYGNIRVLLFNLVQSAVYGGARYSQLVSKAFTQPYGAHTVAGNGTHKRGASAKGVIEYALLQKV